MLHHNSLVGGNHYIQNWEVADEAARLALVVSASDVGKVARQLDTGGFYLLADNSPMTWEGIGASSENQVALIQIKNNTGVTITKGSVVYISGASGGIAEISLADATAAATADEVIGLVRADILDTEVGFAVTLGKLVGLDTSAFADGAKIYLSETAGLFTDTLPTPPAFHVMLGHVVNSHPVSGSIYVQVQLYITIDDSSGVDTTGKTDGSLLIWDATLGVWVAAELASNLQDIGGLSLTGNAGKVVGVNVTETALELRTVTGGGGGIDRATTFELFDDFLISSNLPDWLAVQANGGYLRYNEAGTGVGNFTLSTLATTNGISGILKQYNGIAGANANGLFRLNLGIYTFESCLQLIAIPGAGNTGFIRLGFIDLVGASPVNGVYAQIDATTNVWRLVVRVGGVEVISSSATVAVLSTNILVKIVVDAVAGQALLYINNVLVITLTTPIPTNPTSVSFQVLKLTGTSQITMIPDFFRMQVDYTTPRY